MQQGLSMFSCPAHIVSSQSDSPGPFSLTFIGNVPLCKKIRSPYGGLPLFLGGLWASARAASGKMAAEDVVACAAGLKKGAEMALHCWETRGCDDEMASRCPHNIPGERCPGDCKFAVCDRPTHETAWGLDMLENPDVDREVVVKEFCLTCKFFIAHGPKVGSPESIKAREIVDARPYAVKRG